MFCGICNFTSSHALPNPLAYFTSKFLFSFLLADSTDTLVEFVDMILKDQDYNNDGYIDYPEYISYYSKFDDNKPPAAVAPPPPLPTSK